MQNLIDDLGGPSAVARMTGCKTPSVVEWRRRGIPAERCPAIERGTAGKFACEQIFPSAQWVRMPDPAWPWHPDGRPLWDFTAVRAVAAAQEAA